jgi:hypothetical protein
MSLLAHGVGSRTDLPVSEYLVLYGAGAAVLVSFAAITAFWHAPLLGGSASGRPLPQPIQRVLDSKTVRAAAQAFVLSVAAFVTLVGLAGPKEPGDNLAPWAVYVSFWVGLVPASLVLGPVWRVVNPLRLLHRIVSRITGPAPGAALLPALGFWPAALMLALFVWLELVYPDRADPRTTAAFLLAYALVNIAAALWFGDGWFARGDAFEVYSTLLGHLSPFGRRNDGKLVLRNPLSNARTIPVERGLVAVVVVLLGSTVFDGLTRTDFWQAGPGARNDVLSGTAVLLVMMGAVLLIYLTATRCSAVLSGLPAALQPRVYAHSMVPVVTGYTVAHYFSLFALDGQRTWQLVSNPFGMPDVDVFGTYSHPADYGIVSTTLIANVQVGAVVVGHIVGVLLAHEQAVRDTRRGQQADERPLALAMVAFTVLGLSLLFGT